MQSTPTLHLPGHPSATAAVLLALGIGFAGGLSGCQSEPRTYEDRTIGMEAPAAGEVEARLGAANAARVSGDYDQALRMFREVLAVNPTLVDAYLGIGEIRMAQGDYAAAEPAFDRAARLEPRNFAAQFGHGRVLQALGRFLEAIRAYHRALSIQPESFDANLDMARTYLAIDDARGAVVYAEKAVQLMPGSGEARLTLGQALERSGRASEAITQFETAIELVDPTPDLLYSLIRAYGDLQRYDEAANAAQFLVRIAPTANAFERLGWAKFRLGRFDESMKAYQEAVVLEPTNWPALNGIGVNALNTWLLGQRSNGAAALEARDAFTRSLRLNPDQPKVVRLLTTYQI